MEDDETLFIVEYKMFKDLCDALSKPCSCQWMPGTWKLDSALKGIGHVHLA